MVAGEQVCEQQVSKPAMTDWSQVARALFAANSQDVRKTLKCKGDMASLETLYAFAARTKSQADVQQWLTAQTSKEFTPWGKLCAEAVLQARRGVYWLQFRMDLERAVNV